MPGIEKPGGEYCERPRLKLGCSATVGVDLGFTTLLTSQVTSVASTVSVKSPIIFFFRSSNFGLRFFYVP